MVVRLGCRATGDHRLGKEVRDDPRCGSRQPTRLLLAGGVSGQGGPHSTGIRACSRGAFAARGMHERLPSGIHWSTLGPNEDSSMLASPCDARGALETAVRRSFAEARGVVTGLERAREEPCEWRDAREAGVPGRTRACSRGACESRHALEAAGAPLTRGSVRDSVGELEHAREEPASRGMP
jgi:hypothetical protein